MSAEEETLRLTELLASLSLATDLGTGQPMGHGLSTCLLSVAIAEDMGLSVEELRNVHQVALLRFLGCTADAADTAREVGGDDLGFLASVSPAFLGSAPESVMAVVRATGVGRPAHTRVRLVAAALADPGGAARSLAAHCEAAAMLGRRLGLHEKVVNALAHAYERWDGKGFPAGLSGEAIPIEIRICQVARDADLFRRRSEDFDSVLGRRRGHAYDPVVVDALRRLDPKGVGASWDDVLNREPEPVARIDDVERALVVMADFVDLKSPWTRGHSRDVSDLAADAAEMMGLGDTDHRMMRWAGLAHDIGRVGVENGIWDKPDELATEEWEKVMLHPYYSERILVRCPMLARVAELASSHHERLDGSGYHKRLGSGHLSVQARILSAADVLVALRSDRPHRRALEIDEGIAVLHDQVKRGGLDGNAVSAVVAAARGDTSVRRVVNPGGLSDREIEVLTLLASGHTNKKVAEKLFISAKTVSRHVENIYAKIGVSTRAGAAIFAMEHHLLGGS